MNIQDVQQLDMIPYENVLLGNDQLNVEEILAVLHQEYNPRKKNKQLFFLNLKENSTNFK